MDKDVCLRLNIDKLKTKSIFFEGTEGAERCKDFIFSMQNRDRRIKTMVYLEWGTLQNT